MPERVGDQATMEPPKFERCSICSLSKVNDLELESDHRAHREASTRRDGGTRARGHLGKRRGGGPATFRLRADHTQLGRAVLFCSLSQLATSEFSQSPFRRQSVGPACAIPLDDLLYCGLSFWPVQIFDCMEENAPAHLLVLREISARGGGPWAVSRRSGPDPCEPDTNPDLQWNSDVADLEFLIHKERPTSALSPADLRRILQKAPEINIPAKLADLLDVHSASARRWGSKGKMMDAAGSSDPPARGRQNQRQDYRASVRAPDETESLPGINKSETNHNETCNFKHLPLSVPSPPP